MHSELAKQCIFSGDKFHCSKIEYERDVRSAIEDQIARSKDVGDARQERFACAEL